MSAITITRLGAAAALTIDEAMDALQRLHDEYSIIPAHALDTTAQWLDIIRSSAHAAGATDVGDLLTESSSLISTAAGVKGVTAFHSDADSAKLHAARNTLAALAAAAYVNHRHDPSAAYRDLPLLKMRTNLPRRPLEDDEILLCRIQALHLLRTGNPTERRNAAAYVAADAGLPPTEATALRTSDLHLDAPLLTMAPTRGFQARAIPLEPFHTATFALHLQRLESTLLAYAPRKNTPGSDQAACSMHGVLGRFLKTLGITGADLTAGSVYHWGIRRILDHHGLASALCAVGYADNQDDRLLKLIGTAAQVPQVTPTTAPEHHHGF
ncbi:hypothetical protein ACGIF2_15760 [Cellulomonas sp. P22]|uniref:hypothetical protein n=1 Tax=Cellulomonas sp. P22 TaxID=3373189 RepID=UPI0037AE2098